MRLHIANNEKIINRCIANFEEVFPGDNKWVILPNSRNKDYVGNNSHVVKCNYDTDVFWQSVGDVSQYKKIIIHCLSENKAKFVCKINHPCIYWIEWGQDLYQSLLECKGYQLYSEKDTMWRLSKHQYLPLALYEIGRRYKMKKTAALYVAAAKKMKYFVPDSMYDEYPLLLQYYPELNHLEYREFFYYPIDEVLNVDDMKCEELGPNIVLGHSASCSCNHIEAMRWLREINLAGKKIITPISYNSRANAQYVVQKGKELLGDLFYPINDYMSLDNYNKLLKTASFFIYNNYRQEAVGNILVALYLGGKVFLNKKNPLLNFYRNIGLKLYSEDELLSLNGLKPMTKNDVQRNREILLKHYSRNRQLSLIKDNM